MKLGEITEEIRHWYRYARAEEVHTVAANAMRDILAAKRKAEHKASRDDFHIVMEDSCDLCGDKSDSWWLLEAERKLRGE